MKCILICLLILCGGCASDILALRCNTPDGLSVEDVRKVVRRCMRKVTHSDSEGSSNDEYENFEDDYGTREPDKGSVDRSNTFASRNSQPRINQHYDPQTGGNYYDPRANDRRDANPYQSTYNDNHHVNGRNNIHSSRNHNDGRRNDSHLQQEKDRACILQCFFQELKMTNAEGFPDKHKALHVLTKELRDRELKDFYTDSLHECFHMIDMDPKRHRDICVYSQSVVTCLAESAKMNCADWDGETVLF